VTIADLTLITGIFCLEAVDFDLSPYSTISSWYNNFKKEQTELWAISKQAMDELHGSYLNPPQPM
jgi:glutathione S-transferase